MSASRQRGLGIIEVLIALVVVSLGVLGVAGLQLSGMRHSAGSFHRTQALALAEDVAERMRLNGPGVEAGAYDGFDSAALSCTAAPDPYCQQRGAGAAAACTTGELADFDLWIASCGEAGTAPSGQGTRDALPEGRLRIACDDVPCVADSTRTISIEWNEGRSVVDDPETADPDAFDLRRVRMRLRP